MELYNSKTTFFSVALALLAISYAYWTISRRLEVFGVGTVHTSVNTTRCYQFGKDIPELQGCESIQVDPRTGLAYMACGNRAARQRWINPHEARTDGGEELRDHIIVMDESNNLQDLSLVELERVGGTVAPFTQELRVHGFDIYRDSLDPAMLTFMFVNHQQSGAGVSIFRHKVGTKFLWHVKTVKSPLLPSPNDVVATSHNTFYATNDVRSTSKAMRGIEIVLGMPWGHVVHYNRAGQFSMAADRIPYANGIARSDDGNSVYVVASSEPSVMIFRPASDGALAFVGKTAFRDFIPDNISVDPATGQVLVAGFLNTPEMFRYNREALRGTTARSAGG
ncbi:hypothetical protein IWQ56_002744, partial [Coemansia nantahalensis]